MGKLLKWLEPIDVDDRGSASSALRTHSLFNRQEYAAGSTLIAQYGRARFMDEVGCRCRIGVEAKHKWLQNQSSAD